MVKLFSKRAGDIVWHINNRKIQTGIITGVKIKEDGEYFILAAANSNKETVVNLEDCYSSQAEAETALLIHSYT